MKHATLAALALACSASQVFAAASVPACDHANCPHAHNFAAGLSSGLVGLAFVVIVIALAGIVTRRICASL
ncbi:hypothetical protein [Methylobacterium sp. WL9]|uniref:hypothetical protein n=1 Tax=Methylobacterium sp. WL9 TaxID=2603898 RepID=UPI0011C9E0EE|nr:hypothetical protein [Methylobacterium sp. WL9]TXN23984.1 hypothetical protein FV217_04775 [Methylobacterium sp. WL9]